MSKNYYHLNNPRSKQVDRFSLQSRVESRCISQREWERSKHTQERSQSMIHADASVRLWERETLPAAPHFASTPWLMHWLLWSERRWCHSLGQYSTMLAWVHRRWTEIRLIVFINLFQRIQYTAIHSYSTSLKMRNHVSNAELDKNAGKSKIRKENT